jgi:hypothetical protein
MYLNTMGGRGIMSPLCLKRNLGAIIVGLLPQGDLPLDFTLAPPLKAQAKILWICLPSLPISEVFECLGEKAEIYHFTKRKLDSLVITGS